MENRETYQYELVKKLSFVRFGGTEEERKAAELLQGEIRSFGGESELMEFEIPAYEVQKCAITVTAPFRREIECVAYGLSGQFPEGGEELELRFIEVNSPAGFYGNEDLTGCAALINGPMTFDFYKELVKRKASAIIVINMDKWYNTAETTDLVSRAMRETMLKVGKIPTFTIRSKDAAAMVLDGAEKVRVELRQTETTHTSRDVLATVEGTEITDECVVLTAHYDSVNEGTGSWDNATGAATLMYIYEHFLKNPPRRTMRFIWCGSEEQGLYGSKAYVEQHKELLPSVRFCFNFDMCGTILGQNELFLTGGEDLTAIAEQICNEAGYPVTTRKIVHSSDSAPFADCGIPAVGLSRGTRSGEIHTRYDLMNTLSPKKLVENGDFAVFFISRFVNSAVFPVKRELPEDMVKEVDKYFQKDKLKELEEEQNGGNEDKSEKK